MPTRFTSAVTLALIIFAHAAAARAGTVLLGGFNFNNLTYGGVASTAAVLTVAPKIVNSPTYVAGTLVNAVGVSVADFGEKALQIGNSNNNQSTFTFSFNAKGYANVDITFASMITGTFFTNDQLSYSTNGTSFTNFGAAFTPATGSFRLSTAGRSSR